MSVCKTNSFNLFQEKLRPITVRETVSYSNNHNNLFLLPLLAINQPKKIVNGAETLNDANI